MEVLSGFIIFDVQINHAHSINYIVNIKEETICSLHLILEQKIHIYINSLHEMLLVPKTLTVDYSESESIDP